MTHTGPTHTGPMAQTRAEQVTGPAAQRRSRRPGGAVAAVGAVLLGAALGVLGGRLWWEWWGPAHEGEIYRTDEGPRWFPDPLEEGFARVFDATAQYVVVGLAAGLLLGVVVGWAARRHAVAALVGVLVGSVLAAYLASRVGLASSPPDPQSLVSDHQVGDRLPAAMTLSGWTPYLAWPVGALTGFLAALLSVSSVDDVRRRETDVSTWLEARARTRG